MSRLAADLDAILEETQALRGSAFWEPLRGARLFITGGTGFFGCWLLESFIHANDKLALGAEVLVLTRDPAGFRQRQPQLTAHPTVRLFEGDIASFEFPQGRFTHVIHGATAASARLNAESPLQMVDSIVLGTRRVLDMALAAGSRRLLMISSGAVYGPQPAAVTHVDEAHAGAPDPLHPASAYGEGKRMAELLCAVYARAHGIEVTVARCFAFIGPHLPLDSHFAAGNFIRDALAGGPIRVGGDGTPYRSYLYASDLMVWLWTILLHGRSLYPYNVGSDQRLSIAELARSVAHALGTPAHPIAVDIAQPAVPGAQAPQYVPSVERARGELGLRQTVTLHDALRRTAAYALATSSVPNP